MDGTVVSAPLPDGPNAEIAIKRSLLDQILLRRAQSLGAEVRQGETLLSAARAGDWTHLQHRSFGSAQPSFGGSGRAQLDRRAALRLMPRKGPDRVALQTTLPLPRDFGDRIVLQLLREGYSGQAPVGDDLLNLCLVSRPNDLAAIKRWAETSFAISPRSHLANDRAARSRGVARRHAWLVSGRRCCARG